MNILLFKTFSQISIQYSVHALKTGIDNPMSYCTYVDPGQSGTNVTWDFQELVFDKPFTGFVKSSLLSGNQLVYPKANTELGEFGNRFYFDVNETQTDQYGYVSADGRTKEIYTVPFVKMKYPFTYGDEYSGIVSGFYEGSENIKGNLAGFYTVEADAYGSLLLPSNTRFDNVLRIKTSKTYDIIFNNSKEEVSVVSYRWYNAVHRYPLLVFTEYTTKTGSSIRIDHQAAYNSNAITKSTDNLIAGSLTNISLFPNPVRKVLNFKAEFLNSGSLNFEILDASGRVVRTFNRQVADSGPVEFDLSDEILGLKPAPYLMIVNDGISRKSLDFILTE
jgi:hypothetical protein